MADPGILFKGGGPINRLVDFMGKLKIFMWVLRVEPKFAFGFLRRTQNFHATFGERPKSNGGECPIRP